MTSTLRTSAALTARTRPLTGDTKMSFVLDDHMGWLKCDGRAMDRVTYNLLYQVIGYTFGQSGTDFLLPNAQGRVMGTTGQVTDAQPTPQTQTYGAGTSIGEIRHTLVQTEIPSHNHDIAGNQSNTGPVTANGTTSASGSHDHAITDPGHVHAFNTQNDDFNNTSNYSAITGGTTNQHISAPRFDAGNMIAWTDPVGSHATGISINMSATHTHEIRSNGGDQAHNNIQPTLFYGNSFIYCGIPHMGIYPFTTGRNPVLI